MNKFLALATACGLALTLSSPVLGQATVALELQGGFTTQQQLISNMSQPSTFDYAVIGPTSQLRLVKAQMLGGIDEIRAAAVAGASVLQVMHVGMKANPFFVDWLNKEGGYTPEDVLSIYMDTMGVLWVYVDELEPAATASP